jgi:HSP20 family molecular chaperone IbpA
MEFFTPIHHSNNRGRLHCMPEPFWMRPNCSYEMDIVPMTIAASVMDRTKTDNEDGSVEFTFPLDGFQPEDLKLKVEGGMIKLKATHEEKDAEGNVLSTRLVSQAFSLPDNCDMNAIESRLNREDGVLKIVAPRKKSEAVEKKPAEEEKGKESLKFEVDAVEAEPEKNIVKLEEVELASVPISNYAPEELSVSVNAAGALEVSGKHEERSEDGEDVVSSRQFSNSFAIPEGVETETVKSSLSKEGILKVTALKKSSRK